MIELPLEPNSFSFIGPFRALELPLRVFWGGFDLDVTYDFYVALFVDVLIYNRNCDSQTRLP